MLDAVDVTDAAADNAVSPSRRQAVLLDARYRALCRALVGDGAGRRRATHVVINGAVCPPRIVFHSQAQVRDVSERGRELLGT